MQIVYDAGRPPATQLDSPINKPIIFVKNPANKQQIEPFGIQL